MKKATRTKEPRRVVSIAAFDADGELLFGQRADTDKWTLPGGHMEPGEEPMEAAKRELLEEAGLEGQDWQYLGRGLAGRDGSVIVYAYRCIVEGQPTAKDDPDEEMAGWQWVDGEVPEEIANNLHSPKNITLRLLGLQEGEVEEPMEKKADPHFVEQNPYSGSALRIPKFKTKSRARWDHDFLQNLAHHFAAGDVGRLRPVQVPSDANMGSNMAVNKSRLALYKRMLKAKDRLPPVVVKRVGLGWHLLDGNHRLEAARQLGVPLIHAVEVIDPPLKKGISGAVAGLGMMALGQMSPKLQEAFDKVNPPAQTQQTEQLPKWLPDGLSEDLIPIAHLESSWGKNLAHASSKKGEFHTAFGALGFKPITGHEEYLKSKFMQERYPNLNSPENFLKTFKTDPKFYNLLASAHFARLKHKHGGSQQAAFAWRWGTGAATKAGPNQIQDDAYVQKYTHLALNHKTGKEKMPDPLNKSEDPLAAHHVLWDTLTSMREPVTSYGPLDGRPITQTHYWSPQNGFSDGWREHVAPGELHYISKFIEGGSPRDYGHVPHYVYGIGPGRDQHKVLDEQFPAHEYLPHLTNKAEDLAIKSALEKSEADPLEAMLAHDDPQERIMALRSSLVTPYHLRIALRDEDPDVREFAAKHPMMTSALIEETLRHGDLATREAVLSRPDLQEHHLEQAIWDPDLQTQAALHPGLTEDQRIKIANSAGVPDGLRDRLLSKSIGYLTYPKLGQPSPQTEPMIRDAKHHARWLKARAGIQDPGNVGLVSYNRLHGKGLADNRRRLSASVRADASNLPSAISHETQHSVFAHLRQQYGNDAGHRIVASTLAALDPKDHEHLRRVTEWQIQNKYGPTQEPEERIACLQNYLQDSTWRRSAHKHMRIHMDQNAEKISHDWAKQIWNKLKLRAESLGPEHVGVVRKAEEEIQTWVLRRSSDEKKDSAAEDMMGLNAKNDAALEAAKFLAGKEPDQELFRQALLADETVIDSALISVDIEPTTKNRDAIKAVMELQEPKLIVKAEATKKAREVHAMMPDGAEVADGVRRGFDADTDELLQLGGKHSKGSQMVKDPQTSETYLLKPGSGGQSPASGARQEPANQSRREAAFWHVADEWGLSQRYPRADLVLVDGQEVAVLHMLPFEWKNLEKLRDRDPNLPHRVLEKYRQTGELHKWAILDYVLGNPDRHGQNLMVGPEKEGYPVALIDHGSAFAGPAFDPAFDRKSFIPYYLRAWRADSWQSLDPMQRLRAMPVVSGDTERQLRDWFHGIHAEDLEALLHRYGIDPKPSVDRLARMHQLLSEPNFSEAINRLWLKT